MPSQGSDAALKVFRETAADPWADMVSSCSCYQSTSFERGLEKRFDLLSDFRVCVSGPGNIGFQVQWSIQCTTGSVRNNHAKLGRDQCRAQIVRVAAKSQSSPT